MQRNKIWLALSTLLLATLCLQAQSAHRQLRQGNEAYEEQDYKAAEEHYRKSLVERSTAKGSYNLGNAIYQQGRYEESIRRFEHAAEVSKNDDEKASAFHNLGNAYLQGQKWEKAIEAYKNSLRLRPGDQSTKYNLAMAQQLFRQEQEREQQQQQQQEKGEQDQQQQQQQSGQSQGEQDQQDQQQQSQGEQDQQQQQQQQNAQQDQEQGGKPQEGGQALSQEEAQRLLEIIQEEELRVLEKMKNQQNGAPKKREKDW
ncbi:MAG: tetratricopeptide repeat protein [Lewinellaceae bacterium]|nr:tetratricopeptide repeat protein [Phaeodactylibacter sp.]MCB0615426.1 tetratricopeptide repeat protein [Phaeodactylibacter sp.]MCB9347498.1 tetratricopeptide repeat protein [Lewinellaceae bacterium]